MSKWVQHFSGQGAKWELSCDAEQDSNNKQAHWRIPFNKYGINFLPKSEYVECPPPEEWIDVSEDCQVDHAVILKPVEPDGRLSILHKVDAMRSIDIFHPGNKDNYRLRKVHVHWIEGSNKEHAFIVEKRQS